MYDVIILGGGPAGLSAAIYSARYKLKTVVFSKEPGGVAATAHKICNYPGFPEIGGFELMQKFETHVKKLGVEVKYEPITSIKKKENHFILESSNNTYEAKKVIIAFGTERRKLNVEGEDKFLGKGVSYCATCDGAFYKDKRVVVVGGGNSALTAALLLSEYASKVYIVYRKEAFFRAEPAWVELVEKNDKIETVFKDNVKEILGENKVSKVLLESGEEIETDGVFIEVGSVPNIDLINEMNVELEKGYIIVDKYKKTNIPGLFAAGDITNGSLKQIITAAADGATAADTAYQEINSDKSTQ